MKFILKFPSKTKFHSLIPFIVLLYCSLSNNVFALNTLTEAIVNPANNHQYYLLTESSWQEAEAEAVAMGGHLTTINDEAEQEWVFSTFGNYAGVSRSLWIGLRTADSAGNFIWSSGEAVNYTHWYTGQPDNIFKEDYVHMIRTGGHPDINAAGFWNDSRGPNSFLGYDPYHGVVEITKSGPLAAFSAIPQSETIPLTVQLDASPSTNSTGTNITYTWRSSDGQVAQGALASFTFTQAGIVTITLTITDDQGAVSTSQRSITVKSKFTGNIDVPAEPLMASASFVELNDTPLLALPILVNDTPVQQIFYKVADEDWYEFYAEEGKKYTVEIPGSSVGLAINPSLQLFDAQRNPLTLVYTQVAKSKGVQVSGVAPYTGLYYIRVVNNPPFARNNDVADHLYELRVYLTDDPQQGIMRGNVLNSCNGAGIYQAEVAALLGGGISDSTLTHKTGEFGLPLNPNNYQIKSIATNFMDANQAITVNQNEVSLVQFNQSPKVNCSAVSHSIDPVLQQQTAVAVYDELTGKLVVRDVWAGNMDNVYYVELQNIGNFQFQLGRVIRIRGAIHVEPADYNIESSIATIPNVFAFGKIWKVQLKNNSNWLFTIEKVE